MVCRRRTEGGLAQPSMHSRCFGDPLSRGYVAILDSSLCWVHHLEAFVCMGGGALACRASLGPIPADDHRSCTQGFALLRGHFGRG